MTSFCEEMLSVLGIWVYQYLHLQLALFPFFTSTQSLILHATCIDHLFFFFPHQLLLTAFYMPGSRNLKMNMIKYLSAGICSVEKCGKGWDKYKKLCKCHKRRYRPCVERTWRRVNLYLEQSRKLREDTHINFDLFIQRTQYLLPSICCARYYEFRGEQNKCDPILYGAYHGLVREIGFEQKKLTNVNIQL